MKRYSKLIPQPLQSSKLLRLSCLGSIMPIYKINQLADSVGQHKTAVFCLFLKIFIKLFIRSQREFIIVVYSAAAGPARASGKAGGRRLAAFRQYYCAVIIRLIRGSRHSRIGKASIRLGLLNNFIYLSFII